VGSTSSGTIGAYNAKTGKLINASFFTGLTTPWQIAILDDKLFVTNGGTGRVGEYNAKTGKVINAAFISVPSEPVGIAVKAQSK
jgi:outer membrane protein assembly factor BamB